MDLPRKQTTETFVGSIGKRAPKDFTGICLFPFRIGMFIQFFILFFQEIGEPIPARSASVKFKVLFASGRVAGGLGSELD